MNGNITSILLSLFGIFSTKQNNKLINPTNYYQSYIKLKIITKTKKIMNKIEKSNLFHSN